METKVPCKQAVQDLESNAAYQLWRAGNAWQRVVRRALEPLGLTHVQFLILSAASRLGATESCVMQRHIVRFAELDENMTSQVIRSLSDKGLVVRRSHPDDARARCISLTPLGGSILDEAKSVVRPAMAEFFAVIGQSEADLAKMLRTICDAEDQSACKRAANKAHDSKAGGPKCP